MGTLILPVAHGLPYGIVVPVRGHGMHWQRSSAVCFNLVFRSTLVGVWFWFDLHYNYVAHAPTGIDYDANIHRMELREKIGYTLLRFKSMGLSYSVELLKAILTVQMLAGMISL